MKALVHALSGSVAQLHPSYDGGLTLELTEWSRELCGHGYYAAEDAGYDPYNTAGDLFPERGVRSRHATSKHGTR